MKQETLPLSSLSATTHLHPSSRPHKSAASITVRLREYCFPTARRRQFLSSRPLTKRPAFSRLKTANDTGCTKCMSIVQEFRSFSCGHVQLCVRHRRWTISGIHLSSPPRDAAQCGHGHRSHQHGYKTIDGGRVVGPHSATCIHRESCCLGSEFTCLASRA